MKPSRTKQIVSEMLKENTGSHMLDSGGAYGRHWSRNQKIESFDATPEVELELYEYTDSDGTTCYELNATVSTYHFLIQNLEYDPFVQRKFNQFAKKNTDSHWLELMEEFPKTLEDSKRHGTVNSYNDNCALSQVIQFVSFEHDGNEYCLLQIHGGCDVRGGYTDPKAFKMDPESMGYLDYNRFELYAENPHKKQENMPFHESVNYSWYTDDGGSHFYFNENGMTQLQSKDITKGENDEIIYAPTGTKLTAYLTEY